MKEKNTALKPYFTLILLTNIPKAVRFIGLIASELTTLSGLVVLLLSKNIVDGFSASFFSIGLIVLIQSHELYASISKRLV